MAPRKPADKEKRDKVPAGKKSDGRIAKRPARGYHRFKNGMLNITPKGHERELVRNNQASPLLRLPSEIRNKIWHLVLGGKLIRDTRYGIRDHSVLMLRPCEREKPFELLRTCRQIYAETALLPFSANTFSWNLSNQMKSSLSAFRKFQGNQLREVQFELVSRDMRADYNRNRARGMFSRVDHRKQLPSLQHIKICIFADDWEEQPFAACEAFLQSEIAPAMLAKGYEITIEKMSMSWRAFDDE